MMGYEMIQTVGSAAATYKFTPKYVLKARQKVTVSLRRATVACASALSEPSWTIVLSDLGLRCWRELQAAHGFGLEESSLLELCGGRARGAAQPAGRGSEHTHTRLQRLVGCVGTAHLVDGC